MPDETLIKNFGKRIRQLRTERGLSQEELSFQTGFHRTYIGIFAETFELPIAELFDSEQRL